MLSIRTEKMFNARYFLKALRNKDSQRTGMILYMSFKNAKKVFSISEEVYRFRVNCTELLVEARLLVNLICAIHSLVAESFQFLRVFHRTHQ